MPEPLAAAIARDLTQTDVLELRLGGSAPLEVQTLQKLRAVHHAAARVLATGGRVVEAANVSGLSVARVAALKQETSFRELVRHYESLEQERFEGVQERMKFLGLTAGEILAERMDATPDAIPTSELRQIITSSLDRAGYSPVQRAQIINASLTAEELAALREATEEEGRVRAKDHRGASRGGADSAQSLAEAPREGLTIEGLGL